MWLSQGNGFREEVLNVALATLLDRRGLVSVPEVIKHTGAGRRLPDVTVVDFLGVRTTIEGRIADVQGVEASLEADASRRVDEGISPICIAVIYPAELRKARTFEELSKEMDSSLLRLRVYTEGETGDWTEATVDGLSEVLRRAYDSLIRQDVLEATVVELRESIEEAANGLLESRTAPDILREALDLPRQMENEEEEEDENNE
jgi:hypothetical protein